MKIKITILPLIITLFILVIGILVVLYFLYSPGFHIHNCNNSYKWVNKELRCQEKPVINKAAYVEFKNKLLEEIEITKEKAGVERVSVFFRDLHDGPTLGVNENDKYIPASLLKVPIMITYFRLAEEDSSILDKKLKFQGEPEFDLIQTIDVEHILDPQKSYSVDDLISRMVIYSDNRALELLAGYLSIISPEKDLIEETYHELGVIDPESSITDEAITVKGYASIFRMLYNASYLSKEFSDKALDYLSQSDYDKGLRAGLPEGVDIANKFGERFIKDKNQLHDCGIIFYPENPYLLCVMTQGQDAEALSEIIRRISKMTYEEVDSRRNY